MINSYKELDIYNESYNLALKLHEITKKFPEEEKFDLTSQIRRCSKSVPTNIAEGYGRQSKEEFKRFLRISLGSNNELQVHLDFSKDLGYITKEQYEEISQDITRIGKKLNVSLQKWK